MANYFYIFLSIVLGVISELTIKWKMSDITFHSNDAIYDKFNIAFFMLFDPYILIALTFLLFSGLAWMIAMTKFDISYAYPFTILGFVLILIFSAFLFHEPITWQKIVGLLFIAAGLVISSQSGQKINDKVV